MSRKIIPSPNHKSESNIMTVKTLILSTDVYTKAKWYRPTTASELVTGCLYHTHGYNHWIIEIGPASTHSKEIITYVLPKDLQSNNSLYTISVDDEFKTKIQISIKGGLFDRGHAYVTDITSLDKLFIKMFDIYKKHHVRENGDFTSDEIIERKMLLELKLELFVMK